MPLVFRAIFEQDIYYMVNRVNSYYTDNYPVQKGAQIKVRKKLKIRVRICRVQSHQGQLSPMLLYWPEEQNFH